MKDGGKEKNEGYLRFAVAMRGIGICFAGDGRNEGNLESTR